MKRDNRESKDKVCTLNSGSVAVSGDVCEDFYRPVSREDREGLFLGVVSKGNLGAIQGRGVGGKKK